MPRALSGTSGRCSTRAALPSVSPWRTIKIVIAGLRYRGLSDAKITMLHIDGVRQFRRASRPHHAAALDNDMAVGDSGQRVDVLVDDQDRLAGGAQALQATPDLVADQRGEALGRFVEDNQARIGHQRAAD